jgi:DnaJ domain
MGSYRHETAYASGYMIDMLGQHGMLGRMKHNGGDIVLFESARGDLVSLHFIESAIPLYEIRNTLADNGSKNIYTLFLLWCDMMLPNDGQVYPAPDWMEGLYTLYNNAIYAYELLEKESFIFPVYFRGNTPTRRVEYGATVRFRQLTTRTVRTHLAGLNDVWRIADFGGARGSAHDPTMASAAYTTLSEHYVLLGVTPEDDRETVKRAYRHLARRFHPDLNTSPDAHAEMQRLNQAYRDIIALFGDDK